MMLSNIWTGTIIIIITNESWTIGGAADEFRSYHRLLVLQQATNLFWEIVFVSR